MTKLSLSRYRLTTIFLLLSLLLAACGANEPYHETFDTQGSWETGNVLGASSRINNGFYEFTVEEPIGIFWATAGTNQGDGIYELEATQVAGPLDNGYGLLFRSSLDPNNGAFYLFKISGDGHAWMGYCSLGCSENETPLVGQGWVETSAIKQGLNETNILRVTAEGSNFVFAVNGIEVGRVSDPTLTKGDIGLLVQTLGEGGVRIHFDNAKVLPLN
ncbi:MAG TPA: hypothetical protein VLL52_01175 [Anaerolineae bacterium]|nr:hypothetical protein [Anaerolineae bacterium]